MIKNRLKLSKKPLMVLLVALLIAGVYLYSFRHSSNKSQQVAKKSSGQSQTDLKPATSQDKQRASDNKTRIVEQEAQQNTQPSQTPGTKKTVTPTITYASQYGNSVEVGGYVSGVFEDGGTCTVIFTKGSTSFAKTSTGVKNVNSVNCPALTAQSTEFSSKGEWMVTLSYSSESASGVSGPRQIEVK